MVKSVNPTKKGGANRLPMYGHIVFLEVSESKQEAACEHNNDAVGPA